MGAINPLDILEQRFELELMHPKCSFTERKDGNHYYVTFEVTEPVWKAFRDANKTGMLLEAVMWTTNINSMLHQEPEPKAPKKWDELAPSQQAAIRCADPEYREFLRQYAPEVVVDPSWSDQDQAAHRVRSLCCVESRADLNKYDDAKELWKQLELAFEGWKLQKRYGDLAR